MVDTNVIVDMLEGEGEWYEWSVGRLAHADRAGRMAISAIVFGELGARTMPLETLTDVVKDLGLIVHEFGLRAAYRAGQAQRAYREAGGKRVRLLGDFLIGAHAETVGATLLTRDIRYYRRYFPELTLITPESHP